MNAGLIAVGFVIFGCVITADAGLVTGDTPGGAADLYGDYVIDLSGLIVSGPEGDPLNPVMDLSGGDGQEGYIGNYVLLSGVMWDVNFETFGGAWLSDLRLGLTVNAGTTDEEQVLIAPAFGDDFVGQGSYASSGWIDLFSMGMGVFVGADDTIRLEAFSSFDIPVGDLVFGQGSTLTLGLQIPGVGGVPMLMVCGLAAFRRRR
jgi:hypothetical protein